MSRRDQAAFWQLTTLSQQSLGQRYQVAAMRRESWMDWEDAVVCIKRARQDVPIH